MEMPNNEYFITYSNYLIFENRVLAFRNKLLFDISNTPILVINRKHLSKSKAKELLINEPKQIDVSHLQWYNQINLDKCFNL